MPNQVSDFIQYHEVPLPYFLVKSFIIIALFDCILALVMVNSPEVVKTLINIQTSSRFTLNSRILNLLSQHK